MQFIALKSLCIRKYICVLSKTLPSRGYQFKETMLDRYDSCPSNIYSQTKKCHAYDCAVSLQRYMHFANKKCPRKPSEFLNVIN